VAVAQEPGVQALSRTEALELFAGAR
jgi:hypothetical protein